MKTALLTICLVTASISFTTFGQGAFQNLDFESATLSPSQNLGVVNSTNALPGWGAYYAASGPQPQVDFGAMIVGNPAPWVVLFGTHNFGDGSAIEGNFSVYLAGQLFETPGEPDSPAGSISQTGLVPADAQSILFKAQPGGASFTLSLDGENIPYTSLATEPNYTLYAADVSAFAGQVSDLAFTAGIYGNGWNLDSIEFSVQPVPEPSIFAIGTVALAFIGVVRFRRLLPNESTPHNHYTF